MRTVWWEDGVVKLIDQTRLPGELVILECRDYREVAAAIKEMRLRGAPAIGVAAAYGMALGANQWAQGSGDSLLGQVKQVAELMRATRPTAVNLFWAVERMLNRAHQVARGERDPGKIQKALLAEAERMAEEDVAVNQRLGRFGAALIKDGDSVLTHCNAGALATVDYGTALGVIRTAHEQGKRVHVYVDETRPYLQGARLTAWELKQLGIPATLITDSMAGHFIHLGRVNLVILGADRIAANGDFANKIGTYSLAVLAKENGVPFYSAAPTSSIDLAIPSGDHIVIEERDAWEVTHIKGIAIAPEGTKAANPAFDVTPNRYLTAIITEEGVIYPPFEEGLRKAVAQAQARRITPFTTSN
ncbi:MAG: S-methyl-5-thioribose-1-phosphate isomerase [Chloroflexi bacterium]|nr:S-methyl-5-thioribose-1-phosphate isomerase [Chloroflexota bacterium]